MAGTKGYVLVLPDEVASRLSGEKIRLVMKLADGGYPELKSGLKQFLNSGKWQHDIQLGQDLPERVTMGVTDKSVGCCQLAYRIHNAFFLRSISEHYFYHSFLFCPGL